MDALQIKRKLGQNTAEYMLLLLLIGGGSIVAFKMFGKGIINRFASVTSIIGGGAQVEDKTDHQKEAGTDVNFNTFGDNDKTHDVAPK